MMTEVMIQDMEDAAAWLSTLHGEEVMQEAAVPKKIVAEYFTCRMFLKARRHGLL